MFLGLPTSWLISKIYLFSTDDANRKGSLWDRRHVRNAETLVFAKQNTLSAPLPLIDKCRPINA